MQNKFLTLILASSSLVAMAQPTIKGEANLKAGYGNIDPLNTQVKLNIKSGKVTVSPYVGVRAISRDGSDTHESLGFTYRSSGHEYFSKMQTRTRGYELTMGADLNYQIDASNSMKVYVHGTDANLEQKGFRTEALYETNGKLLKGVQTAIRMPQLDNSSLQTGAQYKHITHHGDELTLTYDYSLNKEKEERKQEVVDAKDFDRFQENSLRSDADIHDHNLKFNWKHILGKPSILNLGARYENRLIENTDLQRWDGIAILDEEFRHRMQVGGVYADYALTLKHWFLNAKVEYDYTRMQQRDLHDVIPQASLTWQMNKENSLTASYTMRLIRPTLAFLNPGHIKGAFTEDFGNADLEGIHNNSLRLRYNLKKKNAKFSTTLEHIFADDGFCAMWLEQDDIRRSTWGNMGVRRAWQLLPTMEWNAWKGGQLIADACIIWDKRIADPIHMQKEHWGYDLHGRINQQLPLDFAFGIEGLISEGKTVDLYSHEGKHKQLGADVSKKFLKNKNLTATLAYQYLDRPNIILTQGWYKGYRFTRPDNKNTISMAVKYTF